MNQLNYECKTIKWDEILDKGKLTDNIQGVDWVCEDGNKFGILEILVSEVWGDQVPNKIYDMCGIRSLKNSRPNTEWYWDDFRSFQNYANNSLNEWFDSSRYTLNLEYSEIGDFCIFINKEV